MLDKDPHGLKALAMSQLIPKIRGAFDLQSKRKESLSINITTNIETAALFSVGASFRTLDLRFRNSLLQVYICDVDCDINTASDRNIHGRTLSEVANLWELNLSLLRVSRVWDNYLFQLKRLSDCWEKTPDHMNTLDIRTLLQVYCCHQFWPMLTILSGWRNWAFWHGRRVAQEVWEDWTWYRRLSQTWWRRWGAWWLRS